MGLEMFLPFVNGIFSAGTHSMDNNTNKAIADQNLQFQYDNLEYQKQLQQQIFDREDSAYERTVNDMRNAGLSPLNMNGTNAAGEAIATQAPHNDYQSNIGEQYQKAFDSTMNSLSAYAKVSKQLEEARGEKIYNDNLQDNLTLNHLNNLLNYNNKKQADEFNNWQEKLFGINENMPETLKDISRTYFRLMGSPFSNLEHKYQLRNDTRGFVYDRFDGTYDSSAVGKDIFTMNELLKSDNLSDFLTDMLAPSIALNFKNLKIEDLIKNGTEAGADIIDTIQKFQNFFKWGKK